LIQYPLLLRTSVTPSRDLSIRSQALSPDNRMQAEEEAEAAVAVEEEEAVAGVGVVVTLANHGLNQFSPDGTSTTKLQECRTPNVPRCVRYALLVTLGQIAKWLPVLCTHQHRPIINTPPV
jgi:hypothetical protein